MGQSNSITCATATLAAALASSATCAQVTVNFIVDQQAAANAIGEERVPKMLEALDRVRQYIATILDQPNVAQTMNVTIAWDPFVGSATNADFLPAYRQFEWNSIKGNLVTVAGNGDEPQGEISFYELLPSSSVPFVWASTDSITSPRSASFVYITYPQAIQLLFTTTAPSGDEQRLRLKQTLNTNMRWQFWPGEATPGVVRFEATVLHEVFHGLGFISLGETSSAPAQITLLDVYRFAESDYPLNGSKLSSGPRDLRPDLTSEAAVTTGLFPLADAAKMSRGTRTGGDGAQTSHLRAAARLPGGIPIGIMDPFVSADDILSAGSRSANCTKVDIKVLDCLGWVIDPATAPTSLPLGPKPMPTSPGAGSGTRNPKPEFNWTDSETNSVHYMINVFRGDPRVSPVEPVTFGPIFGLSFTIPDGSELAPGTYHWELVGQPNPVDVYPAGFRELTILCPADFNEDFVVDFFDYLDFTVAFADNEPLADFNQDQVIDFFDYLDFVVAFQDPCSV